MRPLPYVSTLFASSNSVAHAPGTIRPSHSSALSAPSSTPHSTLSARSWPRDLTGLSPSAFSPAPAMVSHTLAKLLNQSPRISYASIHRRGVVVGVRRMTQRVAATEERILRTAMFALLGWCRASDDERRLSLSWRRLFSLEYLVS